MTGAPITIELEAFRRAKAELWKHRWEVEITVGTLLAGTPGDPRVVEGYLLSKMRGKTDEDKRLFVDSLVSRVQDEVLSSLPPDLDDEKRAQLVIEEVAKMGGEIFKRDPDRGGELYEEGRKIAACLKEAASIQWPNKDSGRPAVMRKNARQWWPEHVFVLENRIYLGKTEPDDLHRHVVHTKDRFGEPQSALGLNEVVYDAVLRFTIASDVDLSLDTWATVFARASIGGFGAARSMGHGRFEVTDFKKLPIAA